MSDLNDDLLNYELGEELDELVGDEDDLLLSDEELEKEKAALKDEAEQWVSSKLKVTDEGEVDKEITIIKEPEQVSTSSAIKNQLEIMDSTNCSTTTIIKNNSNSESDVSTSGESPVKKNQIQKNNIKQIDNQNLVEENFTENDNENLTKIDEVTSTNKEIEIDSAGIISQTNSAVVISQTQNTTTIITVKEDGIISSQESSILEQSTTTENDPGEDCDEQQQRGERTNIKHTTERDDNVDSSPEKYSHGGNVGGRYMHSKRGGRGIIRGGIFPGQQRPPLSVRYPHINYSQYPHHPNENINPQQVPPNQFPPPHQYHPGINNPIMPPRPPQFHPQNGPRLEYRPNFRHPNDYNNGGGGGMFNPRGPRPDFSQQTQLHPNGQPYNSFPHQQNNNLRPMFRPDMQHMRPRMPLRPPSSGMPPISYPIVGGGGQGPPPIQSHTQHHTHSLSSHGGGNQMSTSGPATVSTGGNNVLPRKVLINPNFKGGVEAATNQLMKDTQFMQSINSHVPHLQSDEELLRQQEEFINKNRIHIQKRYARSPDRNRERSYSPPIRKDRYLDNRDNRRGFGTTRGSNRGRRASSREMDSKFAKRRRSCSPDRKRDKDQNEEPEDEETRAYRLEIEKQKTMREKILRDKEMRRRKAAEGKTQTDESTSLPDDQPPAKLKPIIVTESKIISLKKNKEIEKNSNPNTLPTPVINTTTGGKTTNVVAGDAQQSQHQQHSQHFALKRTLPTAKILPEAKRNINEHLKKETVGTSTTAVVRPVIKNIKQNATVQNDYSKDDILDDYEDEDELLEEERLLADTPSPQPHTPNDTDDSDNNDEPEMKKPNKGFMSSNRKVVLKSSSSTSTTTTQSSGNVKSKKTSERLIRTTKTAAGDSKKKIFDRLEKKKIGVNENDKRRIQRIFIKNIE